MKIDPRGKSARVAAEIASDTRRLHFAIFFATGFDFEADLGLGFDALPDDLGLGLFVILGLFGAPPRVVPESSLSLSFIA